MSRLAPAFLVALALPLGAQNSSAVSQGTTLRLTTIPAPALGIGSKRVVGLFHHVANDTVYITTEGSDAPPQYYANRNLLLVEQSVGRRSPYLKGTIFGAALGAAIGYGVYRITRGPQNAAPAFTCITVNGVLTCTDRPPNRTNLYVPIGAAVGLVGGFVIARRMKGHKWAIVPSGSLR